MNLHAEPYYLVLIPESCKSCMAYVLYLTSACPSQWWIHFLCFLLFYVRQSFQTWKQWREEKKNWVLSLYSKKR